jgi:hypothetical protein
MANQKYTPSLEELTNEAIRSISDNYPDKYVLVIQNYVLNEGEKIRDLFSKKMFKQGFFISINPLDSETQLVQALNDIKKRKDNLVYILMDPFSKIKNGDLSSNIFYMMDVDKCRSY